jgi:lipid A 4'-phosphatase
MAAAFAFGFGASFLRLAFGGHYLSDVLLGGLITLIVIEIVRRVLWPKGGREKTKRYDFDRLRKKTPLT